MIESGLKDKVALVTGGNNPVGIGAAIARELARQGAKVFIHYFCQASGVPDKEAREQQEPGLAFYMQQQAKTADVVLASIRESGGDAESWEGDLREPDNVHRLFEQAEKAFGQIDILVNNAADYAPDTFLTPSALGQEAQLWKEGPTISTIDEASHDRHFATNCRAVAILMSKFAGRIIEKKRCWGRIVNISADCAWGCPRETSYRASKYALESYSRSAAAELGPYGITVNIVSPGPIQSGYIAPEAERTLIADIPLRRVGRPEDIANAVVFFASEQAAWITGQLLFVHGGHRMAFGL
ncbi:MAG: SDR family NAD(P)-dependent oxidoreductase [Planctomycetota bacterium]|jgi:3-oxoacyl-[acyl-carrier protein] reductase